MKTLNRRDFIKASAAGFGSAIISTGLSACYKKNTPRQNVSFNHGVASGDPLHDRVILWTKITVENDEPSYVSWQVIDSETHSLVNSGEAKVSAANGHTVKIDASGLKAGKSYTYQFQSNGVRSPLGKCKTLPTGDVSAAKFSIVSCSNYPAGYFNVYGAIAKQHDLNAVLHLGDYIYEYGTGGFGTDTATALGREFITGNDKEIIYLEDYRTRYAQYRSDEQLQVCHQNHCFITVLDDHEITNDANKTNAKNHNEGEGDYQTRKLNALQAYFEWMPIRTASSESGDYQTYRKFSFGKLLDLYMLDTRLEGRDIQMQHGPYFSDSGFDETTFNKDRYSTQRSLLGVTQKHWLEDEMAKSDATWQVFGQQVIMANMVAPTAVVQRKLSFQHYAAIGKATSIEQKQQHAPDTLSKEEKNYLEQYQELLTEENLALIRQPMIPYNLDAWDGYAFERESLLNTAKKLNKNLVILAGDTHNAWANNLRTDNGEAAGVEFATPSVTSPGAEAFVGLKNLELAQQFEQQMQSLVDDVQYCNCYDRGFLTLEVREKEATANWYFVDTIFDKNFQINTARSHSISVPAGANKIV